MWAVCSSFLWSPPWPFQWIPRGKWHSFRHSPLSVSWQGAALWCQWVRKLSESNGGFSKNCAENLVGNVDNRFIVDCGCSVDGNIPCNRLCGKLAQWKVDCDHGDNNFLTIFGRRFVRLYAAIPLHLQFFFSLAFEYMLCPIWNLPFCISPCIYVCCHCKLLL